MNTKQKIHQASLAQWSVRFSEQKASGLTVRQWCLQNNLSIHKYNYWKHQLKEDVVDQMLPEIVQISVPSSLSSSNATPAANNHTVPDRVDRTIRATRANYTNTNIRLCIDGVALELEPSVSEDFLRALIRAVHYA